MGVDCLLQFFFGVVDYQGGVSDSKKASIEEAV